MREITYREALREALREEMSRDPAVFLIGEDIADPWGGAYKVTSGLSEEFGRERVRNTPISESAIIGTALGAAITGMRPVVEIMYMDFITLAMDQIVNQAAKMRYMTGGQVKAPLVIRTQGGAGGSAGPHHSQCLEAWFFHVPGLMVVMPSTPYDAKGLLKTCIRSDNPVLFFEHRLLYTKKGFVPEEEYIIPLQSADIKREGEDITVVAASLMVHFALEAAEELSQEGINAEVIDPRSLVPLDKKRILESVKKTGKVVIVHQAVERGGIGAEIAAMIAKEAFDYLDAPIERVAARNVPVPFAPALEKAVLPSKDDIINAIRGLF